MSDRSKDDKSEGSQRPPEVMDGPFLEFELETQIELLMHEDAYRYGRNSKTLAKYPGFRIVLTVSRQVLVSSNIPRQGQFPYKPCVVTYECT